MSREQVSNYVSGGYCPSEWKILNENVFILVQSKYLGRQELVLVPDIITPGSGVTWNQNFC